jgi:hypothetical protein
MIKKVKSKRCKLTGVFIGLFLIIQSNNGLANTIDNTPVMNVEIMIPALQVNPYHKPYIAVWLETIDRQYVTTIKLMADDKEWYKDLRQWWRKAGRQNVNIDGVTGATKRPGLIRLLWNGLDESHQKVPEGEYWLNVEASREEGGRDYSKHKITIGQKSSMTIEGKTEFGDINIHVFKPTSN